MPVPSTLPRETRAQRRKSRAGSDGVESIEAPPSSINRKAPNVTPARRKPNVGPKPSSNYGAASDSQAPAQKQVAKLAKRVATDRIEAGVGEAIERSATVITTKNNNTKGGLTAVPEEDQHDREEAVRDNDMFFSSPRGGEEWMILNNSRGGENEGGMNYHHYTASDLTGSKFIERQARFSTFSIPRSSRFIPQHSTALHQPPTPSRDAITTQTSYQNRRDMSPPPPQFQASIRRPAPTNSSATPTSFSREETQKAGIWKWVLRTLIISVIVSLSSAALSTVCYQQMTTGLPKFQYGGQKKGSSIIPPPPMAAAVHRLDKLEEQVAHLAENAVMKDSRFDRINWFSYDLGARVNPYLSSPPSTRRAKLKIKSRWSLKWKDLRSVWKWKKSSPQQPKEDVLPLLCREGPRGGLSRDSSSSAINPNTALIPYFEFEPRYCAPFGGRGKLQLVVISPRPITPTELVVEHFRKEQVLLIGSAPKEIELWIEIKAGHESSSSSADADADAENLRDKIRQSISNLYPDILNRTYTQKDRLLDSKLALGPEWVPVGRWIYQISSSHSSRSSSRTHHDNNVQYFGIPLDLGSIGIGIGIGGIEGIGGLRGGGGVQAVTTRQLAVRVNSNWGNVDQTCLVRVGLHGVVDAGSTPNEYLEEED